MLIIELNEGAETLEDIESIAQKLCQYNQLKHVLTQEEIDELECILKPTLASDHNEKQKREQWERLINEFEIQGSHGKKLRFYRDEHTQRLYFGDEEGFETIVKLAENEAPISQSKHNF